MQDFEVIGYDAAGARARDSADGISGDPANCTGSYCGVFQLPLAVVRSGTAQSSEM